MRAKEFLSTFAINEARGVSARAPGDVYVNVTDPSDTLTVKDIKFVRPQENGKFAFDTYEDLEEALDELIPSNVKRVNDNAPNSSMKAAIVAFFERSDGSLEAHIRYVKDLTNIHGKWLAPAGYKYQAAIETETLPIKPSDLIPDEKPRSLAELVATLKKNVKSKLSNTEYEYIADLIWQVLDDAAGKRQAIKLPKRNLAIVISKYAGEYSGIVALMSDNIQNYSLSEIEKAINVKGIRDGKVIFPQNVTGILVDSYIITPDGNKIGVSSKMYNRGGAASSLKGIYELITPELAKKYPKGAEIIKDLVIYPAYSSNPADSGKLGPVILASRLGWLTFDDIREMSSLNAYDRDINKISSQNLKNLILGQGVAPESLKRPEYSLHKHLLTAIVNKLVEYINKEPEFSQIINVALQKIQYLQILTKINFKGNEATFSYYVKLPSAKKPFVFNKTYFSTGNKGRIGFKLEK